MRTITIAGGGLAGLSLGIALRRRGIPVTLHEADTYPRHRVCGEFISGISPDTLDRLGIGDLFDGANRLRTTAWYLHDKNVMARELPEPAIGISRFLLDRLLSERLVAEGGQLLTRSRFRESEDNEAGVVWACGREAVRDSPWLGLKIHAKQFEQSADLEMHLGSAGYAGIAPVEDGAANICGLFKRQSIPGAKGPERLLAYLERNGLDFLASRLRSADLDENSFRGVSSFHLGRQQTPSRRCAIGDAESMIAPFTGNGMTMAFQAAASAIDPAESYARGQVSWDEAASRIRARLQDQFRRRLSVSRLLHPFLFSGGGRRLLGFAGTRGLIPFESLYRFLR